MNWELFAAFCAASAVLAVIPGPAVGAITSTGLSLGIRAGLLTALGGIAAIVVHMALVVGATASLFLFLDHWMPLIRWIGVAYLIYLGVEAWRGAGKNEGALPARRTGPAALFARGFIVNVTNPKALGFIAAFFPQFIDASMPLGQQVALLSASYLIIMGSIDVGWALASGHAHALFQNPVVRKWRGRVSGTVLFGAAAGLASVRTG